jgi:hypothetical protein
LADLILCATSLVAVGIVAIVISGLRVGGSDWKIIRP